MTGIMATNLDLTREALRRVAPASLTLVELETATGVKRNAISACLSLAIAEGQPIIRVERGVYRMRPSAVVSETETADAALAVAEFIEFNDLEKALPKGRIGRILKLSRDLQQELMFFGEEWNTVHTKAKRYDRLSMQFRGFSAPDSLD